MLHNLFRGVHVLRLKTFVRYIRSMTSSEVSTALKPFYFSVHPDLFGKHPSQRMINENSLKQLSFLIESLQLRRRITPCNLQFYIRDKNFKADTLKLININLHQNDLREAVLTILKSCNLSTEYVDKLPKSVQNPSTENNVKVKFDTDRETEDIPTSLRRSKRSFVLQSWLEKNYEHAQKLTKSHEPLREEVDRLMKTIKSQFCLTDIRWECGWNVNHIRGCLQSLLTMADHNPKPMNNLKGRVLVFAPFTGVNLEGHVMLNSGEVRHNWLDFIKNIEKYDKAYLRIPAFEKAVSQVLRNIQVVKRKFMPNIVVDDYEISLKKFTTHVSDYLSRHSFPPSWPSSLKEFEIVIETEAGPLMVSPTGQFIVPSSCPGFLLVNFITQNMETARNRINTYQKDKHVERSLHEQCVQEFQLLELRKDDNVTPDLMIQCCTRLLEHKNHLIHLNSVLLNISTYYSVLGDGVVCIPWNWEL